jgi:insulysin
MKILTSILAAFPLLLGSIEPYHVIPDQTTIPIVTPSLKEQKILKIELPNGLQAILVSDPNVKQSAVAISVMAGSWQDPDPFPGLAHFLEHMLFLGTSEYPEESDFNRYLAEYGGQTNAYTTADYTSYMFTVNTSGFLEALQRFSSFFKTPLFNKAGVQRELNAIDSEFAQGFNQESSRMYQVLKDVANPASPFHRFQTGNSTSLAKATTLDLKKWFEEHYSANIMRLYILSSLPLDEIKDLAVKDFSGIQNRNKTAYISSVPLFLPSIQGHFLSIESQKNIRNLSLIWEMPSETVEMLETKPDDLLCYVLGHEGKGSLLAQLKQEGLASALSCGAVQIGAKAGLFLIEAELTNKGFEHQDAIIDFIFQAIHGLVKDPFPKQVFEDYEGILQQRYQFQQRQDPFEWATLQGQWLAQEQVATYPELSQTVRRFDPEAIHHFAERLTPESAIFVLTAPKQDLGEKSFHQEPWMQVDYAVDPIPKQKLEAWETIAPNPEITYPRENAFISHSLAATPPSFERSAYPGLPPPVPLIENEGTKIYFAPDPFYQVPRTFLKFQIGSSEIKEARPQSIVLTELFIKNLEDQMSELTYEAKMADLNFTITRNLSSIELTFEGFTESIESFFPQVAAKLKSSKITEDTFEIFKALLQKDYDNFLREMPLKQAFEQFKAAIFVDYTSYAQKSIAMKNITLEMYKKFEDNVFKKTWLKGLVTGSLTQEKGATLASFLEKALHPKPSFSIPLAYPEMKQIPKDKGPFILNQATQAKGDALLLILEMPGFSPNLRNTQELLSLVMGPAFFTNLRTLQQTGYITTSDTTPIQQRLYTYFAVQSTTHSTEELLWRFEQFIETYNRNLESEEIPEAKFHALKDALFTQLKEPPASLQIYGEQLFKLAFEIRNLDWMKERVESLSSLTYEEFVAFCHALLGRSNKQRIAIMMQGAHEKEEKFQYIPIKNVKTFAK